MPPVLTPSATATMEPMPSCPGSGSMAAQKSSLVFFRPARVAKPMSRSNAMHQCKQVQCPILVHCSNALQRGGNGPANGASTHQHLHAALVLHRELFKHV